MHSWEFVNVTIICVYCSQQLISKKRLVDLNEVIKYEI